MKCAEPTVSIIIPTLNARGTIEAAINSVSSQRFRQFETIIIDGGSTDGTVDVLRRYHRKISYWISETDNGLYDAMNKGVALAQGDWIFFLGSDDLLVDCLHKIFSRNWKKKTVIYGNVYWEKKNRVYDGKFPWYKLIEKNVCQQAIFYPKSAFCENRFDLRYPVLADWDLNLQLWSSSRFKKNYVNEVICIYSGGGLSERVRDEHFFSEKERIVDGLFGKRILMRNIYVKLLRKASAGRKFLSYR